jgi:hypothetical protein
MMIYELKCKRMPLRVSRCLNEFVPIGLGKGLTLIRHERVDEPEGVSEVPPLFTKQKRPIGGAFLFGGEGGIRTPLRLLT